MNTFTSSKMVVLVALVAANSAGAHSAFARKLNNVRTLFTSLRTKESLDPQVAQELKRDAVKGTVVLVTTGVGLAGVGFAIKNMLKNNELAAEQKKVQARKEFLIGLTAHAAKKREEWLAKAKDERKDLVQWLEQEKKDVEKLQGQLAALVEAEKNKQQNNPNTGSNQQGSGSASTTDKPAGAGQAGDAGAAGNGQAAPGWSGWFQNKVGAAVDGALNWLTKDDGYGFENAN